MQAGFTGTREGMTSAQKISFSSLVDKLHPEKIHLGDCIGADTDAYHIAKEKDIYTIGHVPENKAYASNLEYHETRPPYEYLTRNRHIVHESDYLIATPHEYTQLQKSGTWYTIRYAKKMNRVVYIIYPHGQTTKF